MTKLPDHTDSASTAPLVTRMAQVMDAVARVPKRGRNEFHKYDYATEADIMDAVRSELASRGVAIVPRVESMSWRTIQGRNGEQHICTLIMDFAFRAAVGSEVQELVVRIVGEGMDAGDKAAYKAMTGCAKYALLKTFLIPTGDDPEKDDRAPDHAPRLPPPRSDPPPPAAARERVQTKTETPAAKTTGGQVAVSATAKVIRGQIAGRSPCPGCGERIEVGQNIWWAKGERVVHEACGHQSTEPQMPLDAPPLDDDVPF